MVTRIAGRNFYNILGVAPNASRNEIRAAYRRLARVWHPDRNRGPEAEERFKEIADAWDVLSDEEARAAYDRRLMDVMANDVATPVDNALVPLAADRVMKRAHHGLGQFVQAYEWARQLRDVAMRTHRVREIVAEWMADTDTSRLVSNYLSPIAYDDERFSFAEAVLNEIANRYVERGLVSGRCFDPTIPQFDSEHSAPVALLSL